MNSEEFAYSKLKDNTYGIFRNKLDGDTVFFKKLCTVKTEKEAERIVNVFKELSDENEQLKQQNTELINKIDFLERVIDGDVE